MTYVLILTPSRSNAWPAIIGGYRTRDEAVSAGREATMADLTDEVGHHDVWEAPNRAIWANRPWSDFTVIAGVAQPAVPS